MNRFADRVAVITVGTSGIGLATSQRLFDEGATVVLVARTPDREESAAHGIDRSLSRAAFIATDVTDRAALPHLRRTITNGSAKEPQL